MDVGPSGPTSSVGGDGKRPRSVGLVASSSAAAAAAAAAAGVIVDAVAEAWEAWDLTAEAEGEGEAAGTGGAQGPIAARTSPFTSAPRGPVGVMVSGSKPDSINSLRTDGHMRPPLVSTRLSVAAGDAAAAAAAGEDAAEEEAVVEAAVGGV